MNERTTKRLMGESRKIFKDLQSQIQDHGKFVNKFICCPDPENVRMWYFLIFDLEGDYKGGFYMGLVECPA